jgi:hypothetical protein
MLRGPVPALAFDQDNEHQLAHGQLMLISNQIDRTTSTGKRRTGGDAPRGTRQATSKAVDNSLSGRGKARLLR